MSAGPLPSPPALVLASGSPRRRELLEQLGLSFVVRPPSIDESALAREPVRAYVERLAVAKAERAAQPSEVVIAADTVVVLDGQVLGKPRDRAEAAAMLDRLTGREHTVTTGVAVHRSHDGSKAATTASSIVESRVQMASMTPAELRWYVATGEPDDKAGGYAIQGRGALFVERVEGNYTNVVGLPLPALYRLFRQLGLDMIDFLSEPP